MSLPISCKANICLFHCNAFCLHFFNSLEVSLVVHISKAILMKVYLEACLQQIFTGVTYTEFSCNSADMNICGVEQVKDFLERLSGIVYSFETGVLLDCLVTSLEESKFLYSIRLQVVMYFSASCAFYAMGRPDAALFLE